MTLSLNEIEALAKRAARGAGLSWGMSEEAARATRWLISLDLPGAALLSTLLTRNDGVPHAQVAPVALEGEWRARGGPLCPIAAGAALNDCADRLASGEPVTMADVACPLLVVPFGAWAALHIRACVRVSWQDTHIDTDGKVIWVSGLPAQIDALDTAALTCQTTRRPGGTARLPGHRGTVDPQVWAQLESLAHRTYAPATEASRMLGAGAGVSDND